MEFKIDINYADVRVDRFLRKMLPDTPLTEIFKGIRTGNIKVNGKKTKENARLELGDTIKIFRLAGINYDTKKSGGVSENSGDNNSLSQGVEIGDSSSNQLPIENRNISAGSKASQTAHNVFPNRRAEESFIKLSTREIDEIKKSIVYEDDNLVVINKKENLVMHVGSGHEYGLLEMMKSYLKNPDFAFANRIDKATSGMVIGTKNLPAARVMAEEIRENRVDKRYFILVEGVIRENSFSKTTYLKKIEDRVIELKKFESGAKESTSHFKVLHRGAKTTLLEGKLDSGRTHQLRVQLSSMGHPIVGDYKYGSKVRSSRMMLHSYYLDIPKYSIHIELPIPEAFKK